MTRPKLLVASALIMTLAFSTAAHAAWVWEPGTGRLVNPKRLPKETPELQVEYARSLMVQGKYKEAIDETNKFKDFYGDSEFADENQFLRGEIRMAQEKYLDAAKEFQQVVAVYPSTNLFDQVIAKQYEIADLFYDTGVQNQSKSFWHIFKKRPFRRAIEVYTMVIDNQPFTDSAAEAQYKLGLCHHTLEEYVEAAFEYRRVIEDYGMSEWVDDASYGLCKCYYDGSLPALYDQTPSQLAVAAIDDFNSRFPNDSRVGELTAMRQEMYERVAEQRLLTAKFYEKRRKFESAAIYYEVVVDQFPGTVAAQEASAWLSEHGHSSRYEESNA
ncbi:MAG: hypothetical protein AMXMBFR84_16230 [Candidatus Hydrogenedentota bacterium]